MSDGKHAIAFGRGTHNEIFTTGAYCRPERVMKNGHQMWQWVILEFMDESFTFEGEYIDPVELALTREGLYCEE